MRLQLLDDFGAAKRRGEHERCHAATVVSIYLPTALEQQRNDVFVALECHAAERSLPAIVTAEGEALIVMKEGHRLGDQVLNFCHRNDLHPNISFRSAQLETIQSLVCAEMGLSLIPAMAAKQGQRSVPQYRSFSSPRPTRKIVAAWPKQRPPGRAAAEFLKIISARFGKSSR